MLKKYFIHNTVAIAVLALAVVVSSCQPQTGETQTTDTGIEYTLLKAGDGEKPQDGEVMLLNMAWKLPDDSAYRYNSMEQGGTPVPYQYTDSLASSGGLEEAYSLLRVGDSAEFKIPASNIFTQPDMQLPPDVTMESTMVFNIAVRDIQSEDEYREAQLSQMQERLKRQIAITEERTNRLIEANQQQIKEDSIAISEYLANNNMEAQVTESGLHYIILEEGEGGTPDKGDQVSVHYEGTLLSGEKFDSSYDRGEPFKFPLGVGNVIPGWDEGISLMQKGGKAKLFVPSTLAYGPKARGDVIKENSILVFEVELVDFTEFGS